MTEAVDAFNQETKYVTLLIFWLLSDVCLLLLHVSFIFDCLVYFFHYSVLRVRFYNKINKLLNSAYTARVLLRVNTRHSARIL